MLGLSPQSRQAEPFHVSEGHRRAIHRSFAGRFPALREFIFSPWHDASPPYKCLGAYPQGAVPFSFLIAVSPRVARYFSRHTQPTPVSHELSVRTFSPARARLFILFPEVPSIGFFFETARQSLSFLMASIVVSALESYYALDSLGIGR